MFSAETCFFQQEKVWLDDRTRTSRKDFIVDVAVNSPWGGTVYLNIDGHYFHSRTELQMLKDQRRDRGLASFARVVDIPDTVCYDDQTFVNFLAREMVIAA